MIDVVALLCLGALAVGFTIKPPNFDTVKDDKKEVEDEIDHGEAKNRNIHTAAGIAHTANSHKGGSSNFQA